MIFDWLIPCLGNCAACRGHREKDFVFFDVADAGAVVEDGDFPPRRDQHNGGGGRRP